MTIILKSNKHKLEHIYKSEIKCNFFAAINFFDYQDNNSEYLGKPKPYKEYKHLPYFTQNNFNCLHKHFYIVIDSVNTIFYS